jgi:hypothetical protein
MQSALIWFNKGLNPLSLASLKVILSDNLCCTVEDTEWRLDSFVVPQLKVTAPAQFLLQIEDNPRYVPAEAKETAEEFGRALPPIKRAALASCDARVRFGENEPPAATGSDGSVNVFAGWTTLDPSEPVFRSILRAITAQVDGFLWDNVHGTFWYREGPG